MKNILALTDFSQPAEDAAEVALLLASKLHANLLLFNTYVTNAAVPFIGEPWQATELFWGDDDSTDNLNGSASRLKKLAATIDEHDYQPAIYCDNGEGQLSTVIGQIIERQKIEMIVMGSRSHHPDDMNVFGSDLNAVIQHSTRPVLVIPAKFRPDKIKKVVFATAFDDADHKALFYLSKLSEVLGFQIEVVHITHTQGGNRQNAYPAANELTGSDGWHLNRKVTYHELQGDDIAENITRICEQEGAGLLSVVHHQHSLISRLFHSSVTKKMLQHQQTPLLIFPSRMS